MLKIPTFGTDISGHNINIQYDRLDIDWGAVKTGGANVGSLYEANLARTHTDGIRSIGKPLTQYFVTGPVDPVKCAQFVVDKLLFNYNEEHDVLALDNELIDAGEFWLQGKAVAFFDELHRLIDHPYNRMWHYAGAAASGGGYRNRGPWNELESRGIRRWWSAYGNIPQSRTPDHEPSLQGSLSDWDIHQFTNRAPVYDGEPQRYLDGNVTKRSVRELFNF